MVFASEFDKTSIADREKGFCDHITDAAVKCFIFVLEVNTVRVSIYEW